MITDLTYDRPAIMNCRQLLETKRHFYFILAQSRGSIYYRLLRLDIVVVAGTGCCPAVGYRGRRIWLLRITNCQNSAPLITAVTRTDGVTHGLVSARYGLRL